MGTVDRHSKSFLSNGTFRWSKSEAKAWSEVKAQLKSPQSGKIIRVNFKMRLVAATVIVLMALGAFLRFYSVTEATPPGVHKMVMLPDGSTVELNAMSTLKYHPYWWHFKRIVSFEGEGYFKVERGRKFLVQSDKGKTQVIGTSFNIYSRDTAYQVTCLTGQVKVTSGRKESVFLNPGSKAEVGNDGEIKVWRHIETDSVISWTKNVFVFRKTPIKDVFREIERQYGITIQTNFNSKATYTGKFTKEQNVEDILGYICPAVGLKYEKKTSSLYIVTLENE